MTADVLDDYLVAPHHVTTGYQAVEQAVSSLRAASLEEVLAAAELQTRVDRKYLVPAPDFLTLAAELAPGFRVLQIAGRRMFGYESVYFDTPELSLYRAHLQGRRRRYKIRTRTYLDSDETMFEVKLKGRRGETVKERQPHPVTDRSRITPEARNFLDGLLEREYGLRAPALQPSLTTTYSRSTLVDLAGGHRLTCDVDLACTADSTREMTRDHVLVESKTSGAGGPADLVLRELGIRPVSVSKYCVGIALLNPDLPGNPWHRVLHRYFDYDRKVPHTAPICVAV